MCSSDLQCGVLTDDRLDNDQTLLQLNRIALSYARAGVDIIAPSGMMDGMVQSIRSTLDQAHFHQVLIMSYAVKYASDLYGPFKHAAGSVSAVVSDRKHHQMNPAQRKEALREATLDVQEGADFLMVKPAAHYLDIVSQLREQFQLPLVAYHVSGSYMMTKYGAEKGLFNEKEAFYEIYLCMKRAGSDLIISYYAKEMAQFLKECM